MDTVTIHFKDHIAIVQLNRPKANAINTRLAQDLTQAISSLAEADYVRGAILTGQGNIFSAGLDIVELYGYDQDALDRLWEAFDNMVRGLVAFPKPLIAAINGHSPAGGCVLAMCCDHRIMADGDFRIGLNEVPVGIVVPRPVVELAAFTVGHTKAARMFMNGLLMTPPEALAFGLIDEHCPQAEVLLWAETKLNKWLAFSDTAWRKTKEIARRPLREALNLDISDGYGETIRAWWSNESRAAIGKAVEGLTKKKK